MPTEIGIRELKNQASRVIRAVREEGSAYVVTVRGEPVAVLRPLDEEERKRLRQDELQAKLAEMDALAQKISEAWVSDKTAVELVSEQRKQSYAHHRCQCLCSPIPEE